MFIYFLKEYQRLQEERVAAFKEYADEVKSGRFPEARHLVAMDEAVLQEAIQAIEGACNDRSKQS